MFFRKTAQNEEQGEKNGYINALADAYLDDAFKKYDTRKLKDIVRGKFASLKYTLSGFDPSDLSYKEKITLINLVFDFAVQEKGINEAKEQLEKIGLQVKDRLGVNQAFEEGIKDLPEGVFEIHKISGLSKEELEAKVKQCLIELDKAKSIADKSVAEKTVSLAAERDMLEAILYNASDGVFALDRSGKIITFNKAMEELTGYSFDEVEGGPADDYIRLFEASEPVEVGKYCSMPGITLGPNGFIREKITLVTRNGKKKYVSMKSSAITEGRQVNIGCIVTLKDVTKEIDLETMKLDFVSMAAHELRTPLTAMRGYLSLLKDEAKDELSEEHEEYLDRIVLSTDQLYVLIENLLNISKIERGTLVLSKTKQNWIKLVKETVDQFLPTAESLDLKLEFVESKSTVPDVYVDKTTVVEVLSNLLDNALRYTPAGGRVSVFVEEAEGRVITHVKDTGIGIPQASIPHLFKKFYRVSTVLKEGKKGTGLGLFISREIVKLHNGDIWVESKEGEGSTFSFSLPIENGKKDTTN